MNREDIIRMAREAGFDLEMWQLSLGCNAGGTHEELERFAALVAAAEREACLSCYSPDDTATDWADKIRARGKA